MSLSLSLSSLLFSSLSLYVSLSPFLFMLPYARQVLFFPYISYCFLYLLCETNFLPQQLTHCIHPHPWPWQLLACSLLSTHLTLSLMISTHTQMYHTTYIPHNTTHKQMLIYTVRMHTLVKPLSAQKTFLWGKNCTAGGKTIHTWHDTRKLYATHRQMDWLAQDVMRHWMRSCIWSPALL